jgi:hypothetical protein
LNIEIVIENSICGKFQSMFAAEKGIVISTIPEFEEFYKWHSSEERMCGSYSR